MAKFDVTNLYNRRNVNRWERVCVGDTFHRLTYSYPDKIALIGWKGAYAYPENERLTFIEADAKVNQIANSLIERGLQRGDRVLLYCHNSVESYLIKIATSKAGGVVVPVNPMIAPDVVDYVVKLIEPKVTIVDAELWPQVKKVFADNKIVPDVTIPIGGGVVSGSVSFSDFIKGKSVSEPNVEVHGDDIWQIIFTAGTTALPKGVMISNIYTIMYAYNYAMSFSREHHIENELTNVSFLPVTFHIADGATIGSYLCGGSLLLGRSFKAEAVAEAITKEKGTSLWGGASAMVHQVIDVFWENRDKYDASSLKCIYYGWGQIRPDYHAKLKELCGNILAFSVFGQTENNCCYHFWPDQYPEKFKNNCPKINYVGVPSPLLESMIVDSDGKSLRGKPNVAGEAVYRSMGIMSGYYKDEAATKKAFENGWFHSGDSCMYDEDNITIMVDRYKDIVKSGGENVSSLRVETVLSLHDSVQKSVVIGISHPKWGEAVVGIVIPKSNHNLKEEDLIQFCRDKLAKFETPKKIIFVDSLPETVGGKVQKYKLREKYKDLTI